MDAITTPPAPVNEPNLNYAPGSPERAAIEAELAHLAAGGPIDLTATIGGRKVMGGGAEIEVVQPHEHKSVLGVLKNSTKRDAQAAVKAAAEAAPAWRAMSYDDRASIILKAADLLAGPWRARLNAATMLGQSKTVWQAEIDCGLRADRLLAVQRPLRPADHGRAADRQQSRTSGTAPTTGRSKVSSTRSRRSTSPRSPATSRRRRH